MSYASSSLRLKDSDPALQKLFITLLNLRNRVDSGFTYNALFPSPTPSVRRLSSLSNSTMPGKGNTDPLTAGEILLLRLDSLIVYLQSLQFINTQGNFSGEINRYVKELNEWGYANLPGYCALPAAENGESPQRTVASICTVSSESLLRFILLTDNLHFYLDSRRISDPLLQSATDYNQLQIQFKDYLRKLQNLEGELESFKEDNPHLLEEITQLDNALAFARELEQLSITAGRDAAKVKAAAKEVSDVNTVLDETKQIIKEYTDARQILDSEVADLKNRTDTLNKENQRLHVLINDLVRGATTVSLARAFKEKSDSLMDRQILWFFLLIGSLTLVVFWNVLHLTPKQAEELFGFSLNPVLPESMPDWSPWINFLYTEITCLPFFWMAWLATSLIRTTFKLMEDYDYKATAASTYTGYRDEADKLEKGDETRPLKRKVFTSVINRLEEHPLRVMDRESPSSPVHDLIALLSSSKFKRELIREYLNEQKKTDDAGS